MKTSIRTLLVLGTLAAGPAWAQSGPSATGEAAPYVPNQDVVMEVKQRLSELGYAVTPDANYDANLRNNVLLFQSDNGLRPTGNVDLSTINELGINLEPAGVTTAMAPPPVTAPPQQTAQAPSYDFPLERSEHMSAPQVRRQTGQLESTTGVPLSPGELQYGELPPGFPPGFPLEDID